MPKYRVTAPDGRTYEVTAPEGATPEQVRARVQQMAGGATANLDPDWQARTRARARGLDDVNADPTAGMSFPEQFLAGSAMWGADRARGLAQRVGLRDGEDTAQQRELDAPLRDTPGGRAGEISAPLVATLPVAGVGALNTLRGAAAFGGAYGATEPTESGAETATNIGLGALLGLGGQYAGNRVGNAIGSRLNARYSDMAAREGADVKQATLRRAQEMGYVVPPSSANPSTRNNVLGAISGQARTEQFASIHNQKLTDAAVRRTLGLDENAPITPDTLRDVRREAGRVYADIGRSGSVRTDDQLLDELAAIGQDSSLVRRAYPDLDDAGVDDILRTIDGLMVEEAPAQAVVAQISRQRDLANEAYRAGANDLGAAHKEIAGALEENLMRHLRANGNEAAADAFDAARRRIAITHTVEDALNEGAGEVAAHRLGAELRRGVPLSGELADIARFAQAFRPAAQQLTKAPVSALDAALGGSFGTAVGFGTGNPLMGLAATAVPAMIRGGVRRRLLSPAYQANNLKPSYDNNIALTRLMRGGRWAAQSAGPLAAVMAVNQ